MTPTPEVSAVVLSVGESYTQRAIESLRAQTVPLKKVVVVENVSPFSRALNEGARRVETPFFIQVDADMVLDPTCVEALLACVEDDTGIVVGELRDTLAGRVVGVKLFRTACFEQGGMPDSPSPDTDFGGRLRRSGWRTVYVEAGGGERPALGDHQPDYSPEYTYRKHLLEGARLRHRAARHGLFWRMATLEDSAHPLATLAQLALGHGFFLRSDQDELRPAAGEPRAAWLVALLANDHRRPDLAERLLPLAGHRRLREVFDRFVAAAPALGQAGAGGTVRDLFAELVGSHRNWRAVVAKVALGHGLLMDDDDRRQLARDRHAFKRFMVLSLGSRSTPWDVLRARARFLASAGRRSRSIPPW